MTSYYSNNNCEYHNFDCSYNDKNQQTFYHDFRNVIDEIDESSSEATYFVHLLYPTLIKIVGSDNDLMVCEKYQVSHHEYIPKTKGYLYKYNKEPIEDTSTYNRNILKDRNVVKFKSFNFDKAVLLYYDTAKKAKYDYAYRKTLLEEKTDTNIAQLILDYL